MDPENKTVDKEKIGVPAKSSRADLIKRIIKLKKDGKFVQAAALKKALLSKNKK